MGVLKSIPGGSVKRRASGSGPSPGRQHNHYPGEVTCSARRADGDESQTRQNADRREPLCTAAGAWAELLGSAQSRAIWAPTADCEGPIMPA